MPLNKTSQVYTFLYWLNKVCKINNDFFETTLANLLLKSVFLHVSFSSSLSLLLALFLNNQSHCKYHCIVENDNPAKLNNVPRFYIKRSVWCMRTYTNAHLVTCFNNNCFMCVYFSFISVYRKIQKLFFIKKYQTQEDHHHPLYLRLAITVCMYFWNILNLTENWASNFWMIHLWSILLTTVILEKSCFFHATFTVMLLTRVFL